MAAQGKVHIPQPPLDLTLRLASDQCAGGRSHSCSGKEGAWVLSAFPIGWKADLVVEVGETVLIVIAYLIHWDLNPGQSFAITTHNTNGQLLTNTYIHVQNRKGPLFPPKRQINECEWRYFHLGGIGIIFIIMYLQSRDFITVKKKTVEKKVAILFSQLCWKLISLGRLCQRHLTLRPHSI